MVQGPECRNRVGSNLLGSGVLPSVQRHGRPLIRRVMLSEFIDAIDLRRHVFMEARCRELSHGFRAGDRLLDVEAQCLPKRSRKAFRTEDAAKCFVLLPRPTRTPQHQMIAGGSATSCTCGSRRATGGPYAPQRLQEYGLPGTTGGRDRERAHRWRA